MIGHLVTHERIHMRKVLVALLLGVGWVIAFPYIMIIGHVVFE